MIWDLPSLASFLSATALTSLASEASTSLVSLDSSAPGVEYFRPIFVHEYLKPLFCYCHVLFPVLIFLTHLKTVFPLRTVLSTLLFQFPFIKKNADLFFHNVFLWAQCCRSGSELRTRIRIGKYRNIKNSHQIIKHWYMTTFEFSKINKSLLCPKIFL